MKCTDCKEYVVNTSSPVVFLPGPNHFELWKVNTPLRQSRTFPLVFSSSPAPRLASLLCLGTLALCSQSLLPFHS